MLMFGVYAGAEVYDLYKEDDGSVETNSDATVTLFETSMYGTQTFSPDLDLGWGLVHRGIPLEAFEPNVSYASLQAYRVLTYADGRITKTEIS